MGKNIINKMQDELTNEELLELLKLQKEVLKKIIEKLPEDKNVDEEDKEEITVDNNQTQT